MYIKEMKESHSMKHKSNPPYLTKIQLERTTAGGRAADPPAQWSRPNLLPPVMTVHYIGKKNGIQSEVKIPVRRLCCTDNVSVLLNDPHRISA
jgi:hypothetical protein